MGGWLMARGMLAEMQTGEGKTLTATLPASAAALAGIPVHVISVNDYLVQRDADAMRPLYQALGLSVGTVTGANAEPDARRAAYACDVTYATSQHIAFDYLRDGLVRRAARDREPEGLLLRGLCFAVVDEADSVLIDEARTPLLLAAGRGTPEQRTTYRRAIRLARALERDTHFHIGDGRVELLAPGRERLAELAAPLPGFWTGPRRRDEWVGRGLAALHVFARDRDYLVREGRVDIIDGPTGRAAPGRAWGQGLHQLIEVKEGCEPTPEHETLARITYQRFFRRYLRLAGMSGTAREVASELMSVYGLAVQRVPTRLPCLRIDHGTRVFTRDEEKWRAVVETVRRQRAAGRAVLIGTCSVEASETLDARLDAEGVPHRVLNARQDGDEAAVVAEAGALGRVTVATNMAGRGTDIRLDPAVAEAGGLHVIATQRAEAARIDRQLQGRSSRQGDPGSFECLLSLADQSITGYYPQSLLRLVSRLFARGGSLSRKLGAFLTRLPQRAEEKKHGNVRRRLMAAEAQLEDTLAFAGEGE
jgi:preprotein translocase subunit SecA